MTTKSPAPVSAYAAVKDGQIMPGLVSPYIGMTRMLTEREQPPGINMDIIPVTIIPTEQYGVRFTYRNWRGEVSERHVLPMRFWFGSTEWHPTPGRMMTARMIGRAAR